MYKSTFLIKLLNQYSYMDVKYGDSVTWIYNTRKSTAEIL